MLVDVRYGPLSAIADINPPTQTSGLASDTPISFVPMADVSNDGQWANHQTRPLQEVKAGHTSFREGDVLFAKITPCTENGKGAHAVGLVNGLGFGSTEFHVLRPKHPGSARFIYHWCQSEVLRQKAAAVMTGSAGQQRVPAGFFDEFHIALLPLPEQRRIAEILDAADEAVRQMERVITKLKAVKAGLLHDLLTHGLDEHGHLRDPQAHLEQFKDSPLGRIPGVWEVTRLEAVGSRSRPYVKTGPFGSILKGEHWVDEGIPVITIGSLGEGEFINSELLFITESKAQSLESYKVKAGDLVFSRVADVGRSVVISDDEDGWIMSSNLMRICLDHSMIVPDFAYYNLVHNSKALQQIRQFVNAGGRDIANTAVLNSLIFAWPPLEEQVRIVETAHIHDARVRAEEATLVKLRQVKHGLMDDLLTGRVRVSP